MFQLVVCFKDNIADKLIQDSPDMVAKYQEGGIYVAKTMKIPLPHMITYNLTPSISYAE